jgi:hypothetical protein
MCGCVDVWVSIHRLGSQEIDCITFAFMFSVGTGGRLNEVLIEGTLAAVSRVRDLSFQQYCKHKYPIKFDNLQLLAAALSLVWTVFSVFELRAVVYRLEYFQK